MAILYVLFLLFELSVFFSACCKKRFAESLPMSFLSMVAVLFLFAVAGWLRIGVKVLIVLCGAMAVCGILYAARRKELADAWKRIATPATALFLFAVIWSVYTSYGRVADEWDEFSHWADTVKRMLTVHAIPTEADGAQFPSYPPAMALLQYFVQMLDGKAVPFTEWQLYVTYQLFSAAILLPVFDKLSAKDGIGRFLLAALLLIMQPIVLFYHPIGKLFIDCFLGLLFGCVLSFGMDEETDAFRTVYFCLSLFVLVLTKEVGLLFALLAAVIVTVEQLVFKKDAVKKTSYPWRVAKTAAPFLSIAAAKLLWNGYTAKQAVDGSQGLSGIRGGVVEALRDTPDAAIAVVKAYVQEFFSFTQRVGMMKMSFFTLLVLCAAGTFVLLSYRKKVDAAGYRRVRFRLLAAAAALIIYIGSLVFLYVTWSVYSPYEAYALSSFDRYLNTGFVAFLVCLTAAAWKGLSFGDTAQKKRCAAVLAVVALLLLPLPDLMEIGLRKTVRESNETRAPYAAAVADAEQMQLTHGAKVLTVVQDTAGYEWQTLRYCLQPKYTVTEAVWSFREPGDENNIWTTYVTAEDFSVRYAETYDYVLLFTLDAYFREHYAGCFAEGVEIREGGWYRFDTGSGLLVAAAS